MSQAQTNIGPAFAPCKAPLQATPRAARSHHSQQRPRRTISAEQSARLSAAQLAYIAHDPRRPEHQRKLAAVQDAKRKTLSSSEVETVLALRKGHRTFRAIAREIGVCREVIRREFRARGIEPGRVNVNLPMTLFDNEGAAIFAMRKKGRTFSYISEEIGVCRQVIRRELVARGIQTGPLRPDRRARRGKGFWRSFD